MNGSNSIECKQMSFPVRVAIGQVDAPLLFTSGSANCEWLKAWKNSARISTLLSSQGHETNTDIGNGESEVCLASTVDNGGPTVAKSPRRCHPVIEEGQVWNKPGGAAAAL